MKRFRTPLVVLLVVAAGLLGGWWFGRSATGPAETAKAPAAPAPARQPRDTPLRDPKTERGPAVRLSDDREAGELGAFRNQRTITFASREAMQRFLDAIEGKGIAILGSLDSLLTLRVGFLDYDALADLLDGTEDLGYIFPAFVPGEGSIQPGAVGFGDQFLAWLGATGDRSGWGKGVTIAILDTGIIAGSQFPGNILASFNYVELPDDLSTVNSHGTAVAGLIASELGIAPGAKLLDFRIADDTGTSDTFVIAQAIMAAIESGADIINLSLGSRSYSQVLENALAAANAAGVPVIVATGNNGLDSVSYPAASQYATAVGAIDARGEHLDFSNSGNVTLVAPGLALSTTGTGESNLSFTGTSASTPMVTGAIAATMTLDKLSATSAVETVVNSAYEAGAPGDDPDYGAGLLNLDSILNANTPGLRDVAVASNYVTIADNGSATVQVTVENRGTAPLVNSPLIVTTPLGTSRASVSYLAPGGTATYTFPAGTNVSDFTINSNVGLSGGATDVNPANNARVDTVTVSPAP